MLKTGRQNNVMQWKEEMQDEACGLYGMTGMFFSTDESHFIPYPREEDYNPDLPSPGIHEEDTDDDESVEEAGPAVAPVVPPVPFPPAFLERLRANAFEGRRKLVEAQKIDEQKLFPLMWKRMSTASQSKVREEPGFESARMRLDSVKLWEYIKRSHLTHVYGEDDSMRAVNIHEQTIRYNYLRQGDRELIGEFKTRFDNQLAANRGVGMEDVDESIRAIEFLSKLDPKRYTCMLTVMRNNSVQNLPNSYPSTLAGAYRIAASWTNANGAVPLGGEQHSAFLTDLAVTAKKKGPRKKVNEKSVPMKKKPLSSITCFVCGLVGHYARDCENRKDGDQVLHTAAEEDTDEDDRTVESAFVASKEVVLFARSHVLLDNQASINIFCNADLLTDIRRSKHGIMLNGVQAEAKSFRVNLEGDFGEIGPVYYSQLATANILSFAAMVDSGADIRYNHSDERFTLKPKGSRNIYSFCRRPVQGSEGRFYVCDIESMVKRVPTQHKEETILVNTVSDNMSRYTKREIASAAKARELLARMGYPPVEMAIAMVRGGNNFKVTENDFRIAHSIWGKCLASLKGKSHKTKTPTADITLCAPLAQKQQILAVDIAYIDNTAVLIGVATPLDLTLSSSLIRFDSNKPSRSAPVVKAALDEIISTLNSRSFSVKVIMTDGEGAVGKITPNLRALGIEVDISAAGGHVARIERRIQMVKERCRAHICGRLPFTLTDLGNTMLVLYCVSRINCQQSGSRPGGLSPRELFSGRRVDGALDFRAAFGDYAVCTVPNTNNTMDSRTEDCIVMGPNHNRTGSFKMMSLVSGRIVSRDNFKVLPMPQSVIQTLNSWALREGKKITRTKVHVFDELLFGNHVDKSNMPQFIITNPPTQDGVVDNQMGSSTEPQPQPVIADLPHADNVIELPYHEVGGGVPGVPELGSMAPQVDDVAHPMETPDVPTPPQIPLGEPFQHESPVDVQQPPPPLTADLIGVGPSQSDSAAASVAPPPSPQFSRTGEGAFVTSNQSVRTTASGSATIEHSIEEVLKRHAIAMRSSDTSNIGVREALRTMGAEASKVITQELKQMLDKKVWMPIEGAKLTAPQRSAVIRSSMFLKRKNNADGTFLKLKARLVAGGDQQDKNLYDDLSSPTVSTSAVFTLLAVAAHEHRHVAVVDISGAYLNAYMTKGVSVHMRLDRTMTGFITNIDARYKKHVDAGGGIIVLLKKALYGCVESAGLWYNNLKDSMSALGYKRNECDRCVFNCIGPDGVQCTAAVHVDDLLITSKSKSMVTHLVEGLRNRYGAITLAHGPIVNYLGMSINLSTPGRAEVTMRGYSDEVVFTSGVHGSARSPATEGLFETRDGAELAGEAARVWFHKVVAMVLYLAKRTKPECLTAVSYLTTRVTKCTADDLDKLQRLVRYIAATRNRGLVLMPGAGGITVKLYVDASYGVHHDGKSHTGSCIVIGDIGAVHCRSSKQLIVTKSSTEAELVGLSDSANQGIFIRTFLIAQGYHMPALTILQDNQSCMALIARGRSGAERTRHIQIRYFWVKERVDKGEVKIEYMRSEDMYANVLTKPLQGGQFVRERGCLTGWAQETVSK